MAAVYECGVDGEEESEGGAEAEGGAETGAEEAFDRRQQQQQHGRRDGL